MTECGCGHAGHLVSGFVKQHLPIVLVNQLATENDTEDALNNGDPLSILSPCRGYHVTCPACASSATLYAHSCTHLKHVGRHASCAFMLARIGRTLAVQLTVGSLLCLFCTPFLPRHTLIFPRAGFLEVHDSLTATRIDCEFSGSTAVVSLLRGTTLTTAWVGDSRCVLGRRSNGGVFEAVPLTRDHKPTVKDEKARILAENGRVEKCASMPGLHLSGKACKTGGLSAWLPA